MTGITLPAQVEKRKTREGFGRALVALGERDPRIVVLVGDLSESTMVSFFAERFPRRFVQVGIAEQNLTGIAAGLAAAGKIPFCATYGAFASYRAADQLRVTVAYSDLNVKIVGAHGGLSVGLDGATHQALEEISIIRSIPNLTMIVPCDYWEAYKATLAAAAHVGPVYLRLGREDVPVVTAEDTPFTFGRGEIFAAGDDLTLVACGVMVYEALRAREALLLRGITARVVDLHTVKPLDVALLERCARETGAMVTAEEHQVNGGLGGAVAEAVVRTHPVPMEFVAVMDRFGQSGRPDELMAAFGLGAQDIVAAAERVLARKRG